MKHISDIVTKAGGIEAVASACHIGIAAILRWQARNDIPRRNRPIVAQLAGVGRSTVDKWVSQCTPAPRRAYGRKKQ